MVVNLLIYALLHAVNQQFFMGQSYFPQRAATLKIVSADLPKWDGLI